MPRILFASSEAYPLVKTGGLGDVSGSLPRALHDLGEDVRLVIPAYPDALARVGAVQRVAEIPTRFGVVSVLEGTLPDSTLTVWLLDHPESFDRSGNPYLAADGKPWQDNAVRFTVFAEALTALAIDRCGLNWAPEIVHCNDWQTGLVPALLRLEPERPATVFTVHNLAYQGLFPMSSLSALGLAPELGTSDALEFHGQLSFIKGGLVFADRISTVSPTYAEEIQRPDFGYGLDGLLRHRRAALTGILNGIDEREWDPQSDPHIPQPYGVSNVIEGKLSARRTLCAELELEPHSGTLLLGMVGRLVEQKGIDLVLAALPDLLQLPIQLALLGSGETRFESALLEWAEREPGRIGAYIGYDERLAHAIEAGADAFLMPSRFEPCGLNQMYSLRYGTPPIVNRTGGLADTVTDASKDTLTRGEASGIVFERPETGALIEAVKRACLLHADKKLWLRMQYNGMRTDFSWQRSADAYLELYADAMRG